MPTHDFLGGDPNIAMSRHPSQRRLEPVPDHKSWIMATKGRDRLPTRVLDPLRVEEEPEAFDHADEDTFLIIDTYAWVGEARRNRDVMRWLEISGCGYRWSRAQRNGFHKLVKELKRAKLHPIRYIDNWPNEFLAFQGIMNVRVLQRNTSWVFYSLYDVQVRIIPEQHIRAREAVAQRRREWDPAEFLRMVRDTRGLKDPPPPYTPCLTEADREDCLSECGTGSEMTRSPSPMGSVIRGLFMAEDGDMSERGP